MRLSLAIETPRGLLAAREIAGASDRIATMSVGVEDYCLELGVEPSLDGMELLYAVSTIVTVCTATGIQPTGLLGSIAGFRDIAVFEGAAQRARQLGCLGAGCIHPDQVVVLNRVFSPDPAKVEYAERVVVAFEEGVRRGTASVNVDGKMVDVPVYKRALVILARRAPLPRRSGERPRRSGGSDRPCADNRVDQRYREARWISTMSHAVTVFFVLALPLIGTGVARAADWTVKTVARADGGGVRCVLESSRQSLPDGYQKTTAYISVAPRSVAVTSVSVLDGGFTDIGLVVDQGEFVPMDRLEGDKTAVFDSKYDRVVEQFKAGVQARVQLRFWPTWPATGPHSTTFSLIGFTKAYDQLSGCR